MTLYDLLELPINATDKDIKIAYKRIAKKHHPDIAGGDQDKFVRINNAYSILSDPVQKRKYDTMLNTSSQKTFEIFAKGAANPDTYYSESDLWHKLFMENNNLTKEWNFGSVENFDENYNNNFWYPGQSNYMDHVNFPRMYVSEATDSKFYESDSSKKMESFLDFEISLLFYCISKNLQIDHVLFNQLLFREVFLQSNLPPDQLIDFYKSKYNYDNWLELKKNMDIKLVLEATERESKTGMEIKVPLNIKCINQNNYQQVWHIKQKNYILNIPPKAKNGEIMEFFNKGHNALGWQGDLIVVIKIVPTVVERITILDNKESENLSELWF
ncbi:J domain-containing protein [Mycoplasmoides alvi]|uniref:J domain-containing protein n=1 Tax=Mycoplasmoides alvi TaxID=78580 RepID=UPI00051B786F|nr:J domain-containing protein [Mycoplasmoides alvi]